MSDGARISGTLSPLLEHEGRCRPPSEKRVVAHNPQRPTKNGNSQHRLHNKAFICNGRHRRRRWYNPTLVRNDSRDGINHLLYAKMAQPPLVCNDGAGNVSYVLLLPLRGMGNGKIKTPRRSVVQYRQPTPMTRVPPAALVADSEILST